MLLCFSSNHRLAAFDVLERLEREADRVIGAVGAATDGSVVLATCNRLEVYVDVPAFDGAAGAAPDAAAERSDELVALVAAATGIPRDELRSASVVLAGEDVARHLFAVSSGLESVVVGEGEIAGQVRRALESARGHGTVTPALERLFAQASRTSRGVKNRTALGGAGRSIVRLALELASSRITDWSAARVLLVGTGAYAGASLAALRDRGARDIAVHSRTGRARAFAASHDVRPIDPEAVGDELAAADVVVTCSVAPHVILDHDLVARVVAREDAAERRLIIDLGLPRNVDPSVAQIEGVELLDLETIRLHAPLEELSAADDAHALVGDAVAEHAAKEAERAVEPTLVALRSHVFDLLDAEIARARSRGDASETTEQALRHLAGVLLHTPSVRARELARAGDAQAFRDAAEALFGVRAEATPVALPAPVADARSSEGATAS